MQTLPQSDTRIETGVVRFGDDWPGVFIRGDEAMAIAAVLRKLCDSGEGSLVAAHIALLEACKV